MGTLAMPVNPYQLFGLPACRTARHHMRRALLDVFPCRFLYLVAHASCPIRALSRANPFFQAATRIHRAVMESNKPDVQRKIHASVIALEIAVVQLVVEMPDKHPAAVAKKHLVKPGMAKDRRQRHHVAVKHDQNGV